MKDSFPKVGSNVQSVSNMASIASQREAGTFECKPLVGMLINDDHMVKDDHHMVNGDHYMVRKG